jgi:hypothetical protein
VLGFCEVPAALVLVEPGVSLVVVVAVASTRCALPFFGVVELLVATIVMMNKRKRKLNYERKLIANRGDIVSPTTRIFEINSGDDF